ncbi:MAG: efflux RND transporter periplasmic adaptor subunit [Planctomycetaceae bacterium]|nr:efflux RND transporter periplasmic adaptor subunit [Planctomycetaceae bacterium]
MSSFLVAAPRQTGSFRIHFGAIASAVALIGSASVFAQGRGPSPVAVVPVVQREVHTGQTFVGTVMPEQRAVIGSAVDGRVVEVPVEEGDRVEKGQKLGQLLTETISLELEAAQGELQLRTEELNELTNGSRPEEIAQAKARMEAARAELALATRQLERVKLLRSGTRGNAATEEQLDVAQAAVDNAVAILAQQKASYDLAVAGPRAERIAQAKAKVAIQQAVVQKLSDQLVKHTIISRFPGYVVSRPTEVGQWVNRGDIVAEVVALDRVEVLANVLESHVPFVQVGRESRVEIPALPDRVFTGTVTSVVPDGDPRTRTFPVRVLVENVLIDGKPLIGAGMLARVTLPTGPRKQAVLIPKDALVLGGQQPMLYVVDLKADGDGKAGTVRPVPVSLGVADGSLIEVTGELRPGDRAVVLGNERLRPGQDVVIAREIVPEETSSNTAAE